MPSTAILGKIVKGIVWHIHNFFPPLLPKQCRVFTWPLFLHRPTLLSVGGVRGETLAHLDLK